jgi:error-prone DNA polymerase
MLERGHDEDFARRCFAQIEGFGSYGFPESHAASFALLVYASAWLKRHHPGIFACALLNAQPMGFYAPAQIVRDAREHGVVVLPPCINRSRWDNIMEEPRRGAVRCGWGYARSAASPRKRPTGSRRRAATAMARSKRSGGGPGCRRQR